MAARLASAYLSTALSRIHDLVGRGYQAIRNQDLQAAQEEHITGLLVEAIRSVLEGPGSPSWGWQFSVHEERPVNKEPKIGRARPRIDLVMELVSRRSRPRFPFEAKRLHRTDSAAHYTGEEGLGRFLGSTYPTPQGVAGMLGYIQKESPEEWIARIERGMTQEHGSRPVTGFRPGRLTNTFYAGLQETYVSQHLTDEGELRIYHIFLLFIAPAGSV